MTVEIDYLNPANHAKAVLNMRSEAQHFLEEARAKGNRKEIRSWESQLRKINEMVTDYGLERYD